MSSKPLDFHTAYSNIFEIKLACTDELREQVYRFRYQAFCIEHGDAFTFNPYGEIEKDKYDSHSLHSLLIYKPTNMIIGTVRVILPTPKEPLQSFPLQKVSNLKVLENTTIINNMTELSRFSISKKAKEMLPNSTEIIKLIGCNNNKKIQMKIMSYISLGLITAAINMVIKSGNNGAFAVMDPALIRMLSKMGILFTPLGGLIEYHGMRQPCYIDKTIFQTTKEKDKDIWAVISNNGKLEKLAADFPTINI